MVLFQQSTMTLVMAVRTRAATAAATTTATAARGLRPAVARFVSSSTTTKTRTTALTTSHSRRVVQTCINQPIQAPTAAITRSCPCFPQRSLSTAATTTSDDENEETETVPITFVNPDETTVTVQAPIGEHLLNVAHANNVELEGACGGELACSTCHLIFPTDNDDLWNSLPEKTEEEEDMLDLAFEVQPTSRLGCQIPVKKEYAGMTVKIPDDGFN